MTYFIAGSNEQPLAKSICNAVKGKLLKRKISCFSGGELKVEIEDEELGGQTVYIVQSITGCANDRLVELFLLADTIKNLGCENMIAIIPYFGYSRQDKTRSFQCIAKLIRASGVTEIITIDLHNPESVERLGFPVINLATASLFTKFVKDTKNAVVIAPDAGATHRAKGLANALGIDFIVAKKERFGAGKVKILDIPQEETLTGKDCYLIDDILDGGSTICSLASKLERFSPKSVTAFISHGLFGTGALQSIKKSCIQKAYVTDSVIHAKLDSTKLQVLRLSPIIANYLKNDKRQNNQGI
jgi:ribose-phosphate pyrophosphokinase